MQKHISDDRVAGVSLHSIEWPASSFCFLCMCVILLLHFNDNDDDDDDDD